MRSLTCVMTTSGAGHLPRAEPAALAVLSTPPPLEREAYIQHMVHAWEVLSGDVCPPERARLTRRAATFHARGLDPAGTARQAAAVMAAAPRDEWLAALNKPCLVVHGTHDPVFPLLHGEHLARLVPGARLLTVPGMGHELVPAAWPALVEALGGLRT